MATASCGSISVNGYRFYNGGWSSTTYASLKASYSQTSKYVTVDKITLPSFTNAKFVAPYTLNLSIPVVANNTSNTLYVYLCSSDPGSTKIYATTPSPSQAPSSYIGSGSTVMNSQNNYTSVTVTINSTDLSSGGTYYLWIQSSKMSQIHYKGTPSGTLTGTVASFSVTYNANGGTGTTTAQTKQYGTALTLRANGFTAPAGHSFNGWNTKANGSGTAYAAQGSYTANSAVTLYAQWKVNSYTATFNGNGGGTPNPKTITKNYNVALGTLPTCSRTGYTFKGWYTATSGGTKITTSTKVTANVTYYAQWTINSYTATFNGNGGGTPNPQTITKNYNVAIGTLPTCSRTGYTFKGWYTAASGGTKITTSTKVTANVTYYAQWTINSYTATFDGNGGSNGTSITKNYNVALGTLPTSTRTGYTFNGWYTAKSGGTKITTSTTMPANNVTYYAQWTINSYTFTLGSCTGATTTGSTASGSKNYNTTITLKATASTGYTWSKWVSSNTSLVANKTAASTTFSMPAGNITMTPSVTANTYSIKYNGNGNTGGSMSNSSHTYGTSKALSANGFTKAGYEFIGWATTATGEVAYTDKQSVKNLSSTQGATVNLYAIWKPLSQMFIWKDGQWHRALRYVYDTTQ